MKKEYTIKQCSEAIRINADWDKSVWRDVESIAINLPHWPTQSEHFPRVEAKLQYNAENLYVIFRVQDKYVLSRAIETHGEVWKDSCVEFFFSPDPTNQPASYFNFEINCCGVLLAQNHSGPRENSRFLKIEDCRKIQIASSASGPIHTEIVEPVIWTIEYAFPFEVLLGYTDIEKPAPGVIWRGNFYKCADDSSHPHWMAWSPIEQQQPDFHRPEYFGTLKFE